MVEKPVYNHDCAACIHLGGVDSPPFRKHEPERFYDLYYCSGEGGTVIARYGLGEEYMSIPINVLLTTGYSSTHPLVEAARRQIEHWRWRCGEISTKSEKL